LRNWIDCVRKWSWSFEVVRHLIAGTEDKRDEMSIIAIEIRIGHCPDASLGGKRGAQGVGGET
jgi:hypothetical protein